MKNHPANFKTFLKAALVLAALLGFAASCLKQERQNPGVTITATDTNAPAARTVSNKNYGTFSHDVAEHKEIACDACHAREGDSLELKYAGHDSCIKCHLNEFTNAESSICVICHDDLKSVPATMKAFPARFDEGFNMRFDHAAHAQGAGRPPEGCAACHRPAGAAQSIPAGINSHAQCFTCHTPESNAGSSCSTCHTLAPYSRTQASSTIFKASFRHSDHTARQGVNCADCHRVIAGAPQSRQINAPVAVQHFSAGAAVSCRSCHNDRRAFGEKDFSNCRRCHTGPGFDMLP